MVINKEVSKIDEYPPDEIINKKDEGGSKYWNVGDYKISILGTEYIERGKYGQYEFCTLMRFDGELAWMPDTAQQHVNPQKNVKLPGIREDDIGKIIQEIYAFKAKENVILESILTTHKPLIKKIFKDYKDYYDEVKKQTIFYDKIKKLTF